MPTRDGAKRGAARNKVKPPPKRKPTAAQREATIFGASALFVPQALVKPPPRPKPGLVKPTRREREIAEDIAQEERYQAALKAPIDQEARLKSRRLEKPIERQVREGTLRPPPHKRNLGPIAGVLSGAGRLIADAPGDIGRAAASGLLGAAYKGTQPQRGPVKLPTPVRAGVAALGPPARGALAYGLVGPDLLNAIEGKPHSKWGTRLDIAAAPFALGGRPLRAARGLAAAGRVAFRGGDAAVEFERVLTSKSLAGQIVQKATKATTLRVPERTAFRDALKVAVAGEEEGLEEAYKRADVAVYNQVMKLPAKERKQAAVDLYKLLGDNVPARPVAGFEREVAPEVAAKNLKQFTEPKNIGKGQAQNPPLRSVNAEGNHQVVGPITPEEWWARTQLAVGDPETGMTLANWYTELGPFFRTFFGKDADAILRGFGVSQANASPSGGLAAVLKVRDKLLRGEEIQSDEISTVVKSIEAAYDGDPVESGLAAKLHDFVDSLEGKRTRTWTGDDIKGGMPTAIDIHAQRDLGRVDPKILQTLRERHGLPVAHLQLEVLEKELKRLTGMKKKTTAVRREIKNQQAKIARFAEENAEEIEVGRNSGIVLDNPRSSASGNAYNAALREYQEITDYLNSIEAWGKTDWLPSEVQALGWSAVQRYHGVVPEDAMFAIDRNTSSLALEVLNGTTRLGKGIGYDAQVKVTREVVEAILPKLVAEENAFLRSITYGPGGYLDEITPSAQISLIATPEQVDRMTARLAAMFDQHDVWGVRVGVTISKRKPTKGAAPPGLGRAAVEVFSDDFDDPVTLARFWEALRDEVPENMQQHVQGFSTFVRNGKTGVRFITASNPVKKADGAAWVQRRFGRYMENAAEKADLNVRYNHTNVEVRTVESQATAVPARAGAGVVRGTGVGAGEVGDPLAAEARTLLDEAIARHGGTPPARPVARFGGTKGRKRSELGERATARAYKERMAKLSPKTAKAADGQLDFYANAEELGPLRARWAELMANQRKSDLEWDELSRIQSQLTGREVRGAASAPPGGAPPGGPRPTAVADLPPERSVEEVAEELYGSLRGARIMRGKEDVGIRKEWASRLEKAGEAAEEAGGGLAGVHAARGQLKGEVPRLQWGSGLREGEIDALIRYAEESGRLGDDRFGPIKLEEAFSRIARREVPTKSQIKLLEKVYGPEPVARVKAEIELWRRALDWAVEITGLPRALKSSIDFSAPLRQGLFMLTADPKIWGKAWGPGLRAMKKTSYEQVAKEIMSRPTYKAMRRGGLAITEVGDNLATQEEAYMSRLADNIPGVVHSQRGYTGFLNRLRADAFDHLYYQGITNNPEWADDPVFLKSIAKTVNVLTGRGSLRSHETAAKTAALFLFSPRLIASRVEYLLAAFNPVVLAPGLGDPRKAVARRMMRRSLMRMVGGASMLFFLASQIPGVEVGTDPRSADFLKIKIGDTRIDVLGGTQQYMVLASRLVSGEKVDSTTGEVKKMESFGHTRVVDTLWDFLVNKAAPVPSFGIAWDAGRTPTGDEFRFWEQMVRLHSPIGIENWVDTFRSHGPLVASAEFIPNVIGFGSATYAPRAADSGGATTPVDIADIPLDEQGPVDIPLDDDSLMDIPLG